MDNTDFELVWRKKMVHTLVACALQEIRGDDMRARASSWPARKVSPSAPNSLVGLRMMSLSLTRQLGGRQMPDIFAKLGDIKGESTDAKHKDEIEVLSFSWGVTNAAPAAGGGGKPNFQDLSIVHHIDKATPQLLLACATGKHLPDATITHRKAGKGQQEYLIVKLNDVIITGVTHSGSATQPDTGSEMVTLAFAKIDFQYKPQKADGSLDAGIHFKYDLKANKTF
jgi:type VI secretion system secreted protein Hcp